MRHEELTQNNPIIMARPEVVIETDDELKAKQISHISEMIFQNPKSYLVALDKVVITPLEESPPTNLELRSDVSTTPHELLTAFFSRRLDRHMSYDADTEAMLEDYIDMKDRIKDLSQAKHNIARSEQARDEIRRLRLGGFITRLAIWKDSQPQSPESTDLPEAG